MTKEAGALVGGLLGAAIVALDGGLRKELKLRPAPAVALPIAIASAAYIGWYVTPRGEPPIASLGRLRGHPLSMLLARW